MSISDVDIANLALTKLGADPIVSFGDLSKQAAVMNRSYAILRDTLQRRRWNFNRVYTTLAPTTDTPLFEYSYCYPLPADYLRLELATQASPPTSIVPAPVLAGPPFATVGYPGINLADFNNSRSQDWRIVGKNILTNYAPPLFIIYGRREEDPNMFDASFVKALATYLAWQLCKNITGSNTESQNLQGEFKDAMMEAMALKSVENAPDILPDDTLLLARIGN